jgi:hypothetical protein
MRTKQVRPDKLEFEFELFISKEFDHIKKKKFILFDFKTVKIFESFRYKINVFEKVDMEKREFKFNVEGLSAPVIDLSKAGAAEYQYKFYDFLHVEYTLFLYKQSRQKCLFKFKINPDSHREKIKLTRIPTKKFIKVTAKN